MVKEKAADEDLMDEARAGNGEAFLDIECQNLPPLKPFLELISLVANERVIIAGLGVTSNSEHSIGLEVETGLLQTVSLSDFKLKRTLYQISVNSKKLSKA